MITVYYVHDSSRTPEPVECKMLSFPNLDALGRMMYENTHYATEEAAWEKIRRTAPLWTENADRDLQVAKIRLTKAEQFYARAIEHVTAVNRNYERFMAERSAQAIDTTKEMP